MPSLSYKIARINFKMTLEYMPEHERDFLIVKLFAGGV